MIITETIEVPYFEGYTCLGWKVPKKGEYLLYNGMLLLSVGHHCTEFLVYEKLQPKRHVFEETGEYRELYGLEYGICPHGGIFRFDEDGRSLYKYKVVKKVE